MKIIFIGGESSKYYCETIDSLKGDILKFVSLENADMIVIGSDSKLPLKEKEMFDKILSENVFKYHKPVITDDMFADLLNEEYPEYFI